MMRVNTRTEVVHVGTVRTEPDDVCPQIGSATKQKTRKKKKYSIGGLPELTMSSQWEVTFEDESCKILIFDRQTPPGTNPENWPKMPQKCNFPPQNWAHIGHFIGRRGRDCPKLHSMREDPPRSPDQPIRGPVTSQLGENRRSACPVRKFSHIKSRTIFCTSKGVPQDVHEMPHFRPFSGHLWAL